MPTQTTTIATAAQIYPNQEVNYSFTKATRRVRLSPTTIMPANTTELEKRLWGAADELRANSKLKSSEYSVPVLGLIFLRFADHKFGEAEKKLSPQGTGRRKIGKTDYQAQGVLYLPEKARFGTLLNLPEGTDIGKAINEAMKAIEAENEDLKDVLPKTYNSLEKNETATSTIASRIGVSRWYAGRIREGYRPHARHWQKLAQLVATQRRARSISTTSERSCPRSSTSSRPSGEISKSRTSKSGWKCVN
jgi:hypothetical protein